MLAYVFWHRPRAAVSAAEYELALARFHEGLGRSACPGLISSAVQSTSALPWLDGQPGYEDWYIVQGSWALDPLNGFAVSGEMGVLHGAVAAMMDGGYGGLYAAGWAEDVHPRHSRVLWLTRPRGIDYRPVLEPFFRSLSAPLAWWRRQMVLGPGAEFAVITPPEQELTAPEGWDALAADRTRLWPR